MSTLRQNLSEAGSRGRNEKHQDLFSDSERMESNLKTAYIRIFRCTACGKTVKVRIPLERAGYECCPDCRNMTLHKEEEFRAVKMPPLHPKDFWKQVTGVCIAEPDIL